MGPRVQKADSQCGRLRCGAGKEGWKGIPFDQRGCGGKTVSEVVWCDWGVAWVWGGGCLCLGLGGKG